MRMILSLPNLKAKILAGTGLILVLFTIWITWSTPFGAGDLYISLAAGRDVFAGKLNTADDWSFSTNGRIWINQNWGADLILYLVVLVWGGTGLLVTKFLILVLCALFLFLALQERKLPPHISLVIASVIMLSLNAYAVLRPNLFVLPLAALELWLLFKSLKHIRYLWLAVLVIVFWANIHASFIFGLGMLGLWGLCRLVFAPGKERGRGDRWYWPLPVAVCLAIILTGLANPFGIKNLTLPFIMMQGSAWNITLDWQPLWETKLIAVFMSSILVYIGLVCLTLLLVGLRLVVSLSGKNKHEKQQQQQGLPIVLFEVLLALVTLVMAVFSHRFVILALVALAPLLAGQVAWCCRIFRYGRLLPAALSGFILVFGMLVLYDNIRNYDPHNPVMNTGPGTLFERMHYTNKLYSRGLINFINANHISGPVFSPWKWEGYLRWTCPQIQPFIGGRAQQIYSMEAFRQYMYVSGNDVPAYHDKAPGDILNALGAHYLLTGNSSDAEKIVLTALNCGNWVIVYADTQVLFFANTRYSDAAALVHLLAEDKIVFDNETARVMSKAAWLLSQPALWQAGNLLSFFREAWKCEPGWLLSYWLLYNNLDINTDAFQALIRLMAEQLARLEGMDLDDADADLILRCRVYLASALAEYSKTRHLPDLLAERNHSIETASRLDLELYRKWDTFIR